MSQRTSDTLQRTRRHLCVFCVCVCVSSSSSASSSSSSTAATAAAVAITTAAATHRLEENRHCNIAEHGRRCANRNVLKGGPGCNTDQQPEAAARANEQQQPLWRRLEAKSIQRGTQQHHAHLRNCNQSVSHTNKQGAPAKRQLVCKHTTKIQQQQQQLKQLKQHTLLHPSALLPAPPKKNKVCCESTPACPTQLSLTAHEPKRNTIPPTPHHEERCRGVDEMRCKKSTVRPESREHKLCR